MIMSRVEIIQGQIKELSVDELRALRDWLAETLRWHASMLPQAMILEFDLESTALTLRRIERLWTRASDLVERSARFAA